MAKLKEIKEYLSSKIRLEDYPEHSFFNGIAVEGSEEVKKIVAIVTPNLYSLRKAVDAGADFILAHHGIFTPNTISISGINKNRVKLLLDNNVSFASYHIPLDAHPVYGNNIQIVNQLKLKDIQQFGNYNGILLGYSGSFPEKLSTTSELKRYLKESLDIDPIDVIWPKNKKFISNTSVITGGGARVQFLQETFDKDLDCYMSGNIDENIMYICDELDIVYVALGHYKSETFAVKAFGEAIAKRFNINFEFVESQERW